MSEPADPTCLMFVWRVLAPADSTRLMGASSVSEPADPTRLMDASDPTLVPMCNDATSSESDIFADSTEAAPDLLPISPNVDPASLVTSDPLVVTALRFRLMVMLSGPLESELPLMKIFWCAGGGEISTGDDCWGEVCWGEREIRGGFEGTFCFSPDL